MTLVELMVAMALGLIVLLAVAALFARSSAVSRSQEQNAILVENARFAFGELERAVRQAGFNGGASVGAPVSISLAAGSAGWSDELTVRYDGSLLASGAATMADCSGLPLASQARISNRFFVEASAGQRRLRCHSSLSGETVTVAEGIEAFKVLKGFADGDAEQCRMSRLLPASVATPDASAPRMIALKVALVARAPQPVPANEAAMPPLALFGDHMPAAAALQAGDLPAGDFLRRAFSTTFYLRNSCSK
ncbi:hypothetical protein AVW16_03490 [Crenobacter luteus]|uniref:Pilus assembly protein PilW n=2 Tax=Crenobacter luteus TaxID=1452487 RepID=A0A165ELB5_9NEIS|nr:hypothetical protein AVW16_03490 [Crenobacter luteus]